MKTQPESPKPPKGRAKQQPALYPSSRTVDRVLNFFGFVLGGSTELANSWFGEPLDGSQRVARPEYSFYEQESVALPVQQ